MCVYGYMHICTPLHFGRLQSECLDGNTYIEVEQFGNLYIFACIYRYVYIMAQHCWRAFAELTECMNRRKYRGPNTVHRNRRLLQAVMTNRAHICTAF